MKLLTLFCLQTSHPTNPFFISLIFVHFFVRVLLLLLLEELFFKEKKEFEIIIKQTYIMNFFLLQMWKVIFSYLYILSRCISFYL